MLDDYQHNCEVDRRDALRFRRLVAAALSNEAWFNRMAAQPARAPQSLAEVRHMIDYVLSKESAPVAPHFSEINCTDSNS